MELRTVSDLLKVENLHKIYGDGQYQVFAVNGVSFSIHRGEAVGLVGESGSGKSTIALCLVRLLEADRGSICFDGVEISRLSQAAFRPLRRRLQMVFQDPITSLNPCMTVRETVSEPLRLFRLLKGDALDARLEEMIRDVALDSTYLNRYPRALSAGEKQRVAIARAIITNPDLVVLDEPTCSLDMTVRVQVLDLLARLQQQLGMTYLLISHDLSSVSRLCERILVLYLGEIMEAAPTRKLFAGALHPYTRALLSAIPVPDPRVRRERIQLQGETPTLTSAFRGCKLRDRCPHSRPSCHDETPTLLPVEEDHWVACPVVCG